MLRSGGLSAPMRRTASSRSGSGRHRSGPRCSTGGARVSSTTGAAKHTATQSPTSTSARIAPDLIRHRSPGR